MVGEETGGYGGCDKRLIIHKAPRIFVVNYMGIKILIPITRVTAILVNFMMFPFMGFRAVSKGYYGIELMRPSNGVGWPLRMYY